MFGWASRLFSRRPPEPPPPPDPAEERNIFRLAVGGQVRHLDPLTVLAALEDAGGEDWASLPDRISKMARPMLRMDCSKFLIDVVDPS